MKQEPVCHGATEERTISLRARKCAKTKLALVWAAVARLGDKRFDEITVKELCEEAEVSEATFFNYFRKKDDLLLCYLQIWSVELALQAGEYAEPGRGISFIEEVFQRAGEQLRRNPTLVHELLGHVTRFPNRLLCAEQSLLSPAEWARALPRAPEELCASIRGLPDLFRPALERAVEERELAPTLDQEAALLALLNTFIGVPRWMSDQTAETISAAYRRQLRLLWAGMRAGACCESVHPPSLSTGSPVRTKAAAPRG